MVDRKQRPGEKITLHHPKLGKQIVRTRKQYEVLKGSGWVEGKLPAQASTTSGGK